ncbi:diguanylate cyclase [Orenia marismortui]|uniref:PAS domain S-box-containing protein/diguanylate cyclase (GGDEF)-like protein n=1 Tax=Orenia marismortui TaxID=46469 RepID=A0A4R8H947_9FIRM|nr:diguanylate cyclase [Orenia marismortui]TDX51523.1 PAS domain S-box-containing protein/diguanylate cyclase (GGDEF)-like protein [Orenia marismortui]
MDIYQDSKNNRRMKQSEDIYKLLFKNNGTAMFISEDDSSIALINEKLEDLIGYSKEELEANMKFEDLIVADDKIKFKCYEKQRRKDDKSDNCELRIVDKWGNIKTVLLQIESIMESKSIVSLIDISRRKEFEERIEHLMYHDDLTELYNRSYYQKMLNCLDDVEQLPLSIIIADNNRLKLINDTFGHGQGDKVIKLVAKILKKSTRDRDIIARWGGDEFSIILPNTDIDNAKKVIKRIKREVEKVNVDIIMPSIALGVATKTDISQNIEEIIKLAERRMYQDKLDSKRIIDNAMIISLENNLTVSNYESKDHIRRIKSLLLNFGKILSLDQENINHLKLLARLHDIGKIGIPQEVFNKSTSLTKLEKSQLKQHCEIGYRIARSFQELLPIANAILFHHECWDGEGYPQGIKENRIPLLARIISIVHYYDIRTEVDSLSHQEVLKEMDQMKGKRFDPRLVDEFINSNIF